VLVGKTIRNHSLDKDSSSGLLWHLNCEVMFSRFCIRGHFGAIDKMLDVHNTWTGQSRDQIPVRVRFSAAVQNDLGTHPASYALGTGSLSWE
jgi:hypothetical protein